jgi:hypothetical protein
MNTTDAGTPTPAGAPQMLDCTSAMRMLWDFLDGHLAEADDAAWQRRANFAQMADSPFNTIAIAHLGPQLMTLELAKLGFTVDRKLLASVYGVEVRDPRKNYVFKNVGRRSY